MKLITVLPAGTIKRIHVNRQRIDKNRKCDLKQPVLTVKNKNRNYYGTEINIIGHSTLSQNKKQLSCGARVYIETKDVVEIYE